MAQARSASLIALAALILVACDVTATPPTGSAAPASAPAGGPGAAVAPRTSEPSPLASGRPGIHTTAVGSIPSLFRYVALDTPLVDGVHTRLWLMDLSSRRAPVVAAEWDAPASPVGGWSSSADGRVLLVTAQGARARVALNVVRPETADTRVLFEDPAITVVAARISPDGSRYAFTKYPAAGGNDQGIWAGRVSGGDALRLTPAFTSSTVPQMSAGWSLDNAWLAYTIDVDAPTPFSEMWVVRSDGGTTSRVGPGDRASWRKAEPQLLMSASGETGSVRAADLSGPQPRGIDLVGDLKKTFIPAIAWNPTSDVFMYVESDGPDREAANAIRILPVTGSPSGVFGIGGSTTLKVTAQGAFSAPEWSADGTILSALAAGDSVRIPIVDLLTGRQLSVLCRRGGTPPADCL